MAVNDSLVPTIEITAQRVGDDPSIVIYHAEVHNRDGTTHETLATRELLAVYIRGVSNAASLVGMHIKQPEIPDPE